MRNADQMVDAICREIEIRSKDIEMGIDTLYFGGGTPSVLKYSQLSKIFDTLNLCFTIHENAEVTIEVNPDDLDLTYLKTNQKFRRQSLKHRSPEL